MQDDFIESGKETISLVGAVYALILFLLFGFGSCKRWVQMEHEAYHEYASAEQ